ncbi:hypothetical protein [Oceanobacillus bengalensis]
MKSLPSLLCSRDFFPVLEEAFKSIISMKYICNITLTVMTFVDDILPILENDIDFNQLDFPVV